MSRQVLRCALVAAFVVAIASLRAKSQEGETPPPPESAAAQLAKLEGKIENALGEPTSLQFLEQPLADVVAFLEDRHHIEIQLDTNALDTAGVTRDTPVTIDVNDISLRSALNLALRSIELTYCVRDGVLLITTPDEVDTKLVVSTYDASRYMDFEDPYGYRKHDARGLIDLITTHVEPTTWSEVGGTGGIEPIADSIVVSQSWDVQQKVRRFLLALEIAHERSQQGVFEEPIEVESFDSTVLRDLRRAVAQESSLQFVEQPLADVAAYLAGQYRIEVEMDQAALDTAGVTNDTPVTIDVRGIPLSSSLRLMLDSLGLAYSLQDEVLLITTPDEIESQLTTRVYPVKDLLNAAATRHAEAARRTLADQLFTTVTNNIDPTTWTFVGGTGSVSYLPQCDAMIVSQTQATHEKIDDLLAQLRACEAKRQPIEVAGDDGAERITLRIYRPVRGSGNAKKPVSDMPSLTALITRSIDPTSWNRREPIVFIQQIDDALVIQQKNAVHDRINSFLESLGYRNDSETQSSTQFVGKIRGPSCF